MHKKNALDRRLSSLSDKELRELAESNRPLNIHLTNDFAFKKTFRNKKALKGLLAALLHMEPTDITEIRFIDTHLEGEYPDEHEGILDIQLILNGNRKINVEMQILTFTYWRERTLFYLSKMYVKGFEKGHSYKELEQCIHISILGFELFENPPLLSSFELWDVENKRLYSDKLSMRVLHLTQIDNATEEEKESDIYLWARLISSNDWEVLRMLAEKNEYIQAAKEELEKINANRELRYQYLQDERRLSDEATIRDFCREEGVALGRKQGVALGERKKLKELVKKQTLKGASPEQIAALFDEDIQLVEELIKELSE